MTTTAKAETPFDIGTIASVAAKKQFKNLIIKIKDSTITPGEMQVFTQLEKRIKAENGNGRVVYARIDVANSVDRSLRTISDWVASGMPVQPDGGYDLDAIEKWRSSRKKRTKDKTPDDSEYWQTQYKKHRAKLSELELKIKKGELLPKADVIAALKEMQSYVKKNLVLIPRISAPRMDGMDTQARHELLGEMVNTILAGMSKGQSSGEIERLVK